MDWDRFTFDYRLDFPEMTGFLIRIEGRREAAMSLLLPSEWKEQLDVLNRIRTIHGSTALEGNPLSESRVADFFAGKIGLDSEGRAFRQIQNADTAQNWVRTRFLPAALRCRWTTSSTCTN